VVKGNGPFLDGPGKVWMQAPLLNNGKTCVTYRKV
jgi:hypothetical protein